MNNLMNFSGYVLFGRKKMMNFVEECNISILFYFNLIFRFCFVILRVK